MKKLSDIKGVRPKKVAKLSTGKKTPKPGAASAKSKKTKQILIIVGSVLLAALIGWLVFILVTSNQQSNLDKLGGNEKPENIIYRSPLTGRQVASEDLTKRTVLAVMIENSPESRPQSGLKDAGVIFEAVAEGGITRFVVLYQEAEPSLIGPVRSLRSYYLEWAAGFDEAIAHVGGSGDALALVRSGNYGVDLDQFNNESAYWRAKDRYAPHNVYTDFQHLFDLSSKKGKTTSQFDSWPRADGNASQTPDATVVNLTPSTGNFAVQYNYDAASNTYHRLQGGQAHLDREKGQIAPDVVIAFRVNQSLARDGLHAVIQTSGSGEAFIFQNGTAQAATWQKTNATSQIKFTDVNCQEITLNRGQVWLTAVGQGRNISWQ